MSALYIAILFILGCGLSPSNETGTLPANQSARNRSSAGQPVNLVIFTLDTTRADHLGSGGYERILTPNLDRLARGGIQYINAYAQAPRTVESHASIFTGIYPFIHQAANASGRGKFPMSDRFETLAEIMRENGYQTAAFTTSVMVRARDSGLEQGFETYSDYDQGELKADRNNQRFFRWFEQKAVQPFFVWIHYYDPHIPYAAPAPFDSLYEPVTGHHTYKKIVRKQGLTNLENYTVGEGISRYDEEITFMDHHFGKIIEFLNRKGLLDSTVLVTIADHGESLSEHNSFFSHGYDIFEPAVRIPCMILDPGSDRGGMIVNALVESVDVFPTIMNRFGLRHSNPIQGRNLTGYFDSDTAVSRDRVFSQRNADSPRILQFGVRDRRWTYITGKDTPRMAYVFDRDIDPGEIRNRGTHPPADFDRDLFHEFLMDQLGAKDEYPAATPISLPLDSRLAEQLEVLGYMH